MPQRIENRQVTKKFRHTIDLLRGDLEPWRVSIFGDRLHVVLDRPDTELPWVKSLMQQADLPIFDTQPLPFSLEDAFIGEVQRAGGAPL